MRVAISALAALAALLTLSGIAFAGPKLELTKDVWDFGEIYQWTNPSVTIGIANTGDEPLDITDVKSSCGCTATFLSSKEIRPGERGFIKIDFASYTVTGKVNKLVRLSTNDPAARQKDIAVRGVVKADKGAVGELDRDYIDMGVVAPYETKTVDFQVNNHGNVDLDIRDIELPEGWFLDSAAPSGARVRSGAAVRLGYKPPRQKGPIDDIIKIKTSGIDGGLLKLRIVGYIDQGGRSADALVLTPTGFTASDGRLSLSLSLKNEGGATVTLEGVDSSLDIKASQLSAPEIGPGGVGTVTLELAPQGLAAGTRGYVYIRLGLPVEVK